jgi:hypothetical protein
VNQESDAGTPSSSSHAQTSPEGRSGAQDSGVRVLFVTGLFVVVFICSVFAATISQALGAESNLSVVWIFVPWLIPCGAMLLGWVVWRGWTCSRLRAGTQATTANEAPIFTPLSPEDLAGTDIHCPICRYNLRNGRGDRCPECGSALSVETVFPTFRQILPIPVLDPSTWEAARLRTPAWAAICAIALLSVFLFPIICMPFEFAYSIWPGRSFTPQQISIAEMFGTLLVPLAFGLWKLRAKRTRGARIARWLLIGALAIATSGLGVFVWLALCSV